MKSNKKINADRYNKQRKPITCGKTPVASPRDLKTSEVTPLREILLSRRVCPIKIVWVCFADRSRTTLLKSLSLQCLYSAARLVRKILSW